jgi:hypothetical protein
MVPTKITYYAIVNDYGSRERPNGVVRRTEDGEGEHDDAFSRDLKWERTPLLYSFERGNRDAEFYEITEDEANQIVDRIRRTITGRQ